MIYYHKTFYIVVTHTFICKMFYQSKTFSKKYKKIVDKYINTRYTNIKVKEMVR